MVRGTLGGSLIGRALSGGAPSSRGLVYAVGDVHGRADLLVELVDRIMHDALGAGGSRETPAEIVFIGDLIDRGPDTRSVIEFLMTMNDWPEVETIFVAGNHELMLLDFLDDPVAGRRWLRCGGAETLASYGVGGLDDFGSTDGLHRIAGALRHAMGPHLGFLGRLVPWHLNGSLLFAHAGADPRLPPEAQTAEALAWGVPEFFRRHRRDGLWVVHGHSIVERPAIGHGRIAIDTGAWLTGRLTALKADGAELRFVDVTGPAGPQFTGDGS